MIHHSVVAVAVAGIEMLRHERFVASASSVSVFAKREKENSENSLGRTASTLVVLMV